MNILVLLRMVPDVIEELEIASDGKSLDLEFLPGLDPVLLADLRGQDDLALRGHHRFHAW